MLLDAAVAVAAFRTQGIPAERLAVAAGTTITIYDGLKPSAKVALVPNAVEPAEIAIWCDPPAPPGCRARARTVAVWLAVGQQAHPAACGLRMLPKLSFTESHFQCASAGGEACCAGVHVCVCADD